MSDVVITMLPDTPDVEKALFGKALPDGGGRSPPVDSAMRIEATILGGEDRRAQRPQQAGDDERRRVPLTQHQRRRVDQEREGEMGDVFKNLRDFTVNETKRKLYLLNSDAAYMANLPK